LSIPDLPVVLLATEHAGHAREYNRIYCLEPPSTRPRIRCKVWSWQLQQLPRRCPSGVNYREAGPALMRLARQFLPGAAEGDLAHALTAAGALDAAAEPN
jgi:hypothetical protein